MCPVTQEMYTSYDNTLNILDSESLVERRQNLCLQFAKKCLKHYFPENQKTHPMITRFPETYEADYSKTERLMHSPIIYMQRLLNGM